MDESSLGTIAQRLSDLELAIFLSLVAREHCLVETTSEGISDLARELALICENTFDLSYTILGCSSRTTTEDIHHEILTEEARQSLERPAYFRLKTGSSSNLSTRLTPRDRSKSPLPSPRADETNVVNIVIAQEFNLVSDDVQAQMLQLMRTKKLATEMGILHAPEQFLFIPLVCQNDQIMPSLKTHLKDHLLISHFHDPADGYVYLEEDEWLSDDRRSAPSVIHTPKEFQKKQAKVDQFVMDNLREASESVTTGADVVRYMQDIVVFLRLSRAVAGGVSAKANNDFIRFAHYLAPLHGIDYLTPSIVALAARKIFRHRIAIATPEDDRSLQYGSDTKTVSHVLAGITPDSILDGVLALEPPL